MRAAVALLVVAAASGCASLARQTVRASQAAPFALPPDEQRLRDLLRAGRWDAASRVAASETQGGPDDALLRDLYVGTAAYYAGRFDSSAAAFERAATLADDRFTRSASRGALSLATSDLALPYVPGHNERLLVHYYGLLSWLRRGSLEDAAVEARRLGFLLQQYDDARTPLDASTRAVLRYVSGAVFAAAGDTNDASVAFRHASALAGTPLGTALAAADASPPPPRRRARGSATRAAPAPPRVDSGDVLVVVEQGFVAHRVEQRLTVRGDDAGVWHLVTGSGDWSDGTAIARVGALLGGDDGVWADAPSGELALAARASSAPGAPLDSQTTPTWRTRAYIVWPAYRRPAAAPLAGLVIDSAAPVPLLRADLSAAEAGDFRRDRAARLVRSLARAALREGAASGLGRKHGELASIVRGVGRAVERADTRSWHLLPGVVSVARVRLPVGDHAIVADVGGERVALGTATVRVGGLALATVRLWTAGGGVVTPPVSSAAP